MLSFETAQAKGVIRSFHLFIIVLDKITHPFSNLNGANVEVREWINNFIQHNMIDGIYLSMLVLKLFRVSKRNNRSRFLTEKSSTWKSQ